MYRFQGSETAANGQSMFRYATEVNVLGVFDSMCSAEPIVFIDKAVVRVPKGEMLSDMEVRASDIPAIYRKYGFKIWLFDVSWNGTRYGLRYTETNKEYVGNLDVVANAADKENVDRMLAAMDESFHNGDGGGQTGNASRQAPANSSARLNSNIMTLLAEETDRLGTKVVELEDELNKEKAKSEAAKSASKKKVKELKRKLDEAAAATGEAEWRLTAANSELEREKSKHAEDATEWNERSREYEAQVAALQSDSADKAKKISTLADANHAYMMKNKGLENSVASLTAASTAATQKIAELQDMNSKLSEAGDEMSAEIAHMLAEIEGKQTEITDLTEALEASALSVEEKETLISQLNEDIKERNNAITRLTLEIANKDEDIALRTETEEWLNVVIDGMQRELDEAKAEKEEAQAQIAVVVTRQQKQLKSTGFKVLSVAEIVSGVGAVFGIPSLVMLVKAGKDGTTSDENLNRVGIGRTMSVSGLVATIVLYGAAATAALTGQLQPLFSAIGM